MFPTLAQDWSEQDRAQQGWREFRAPDFERLHHDYNVTWVVLQRPGVAGLACPFQNDAVMVCRVE
jgi:hypothetical protein